MTAFPRRRSLSLAACAAALAILAALPAASAAAAKLTPLDADYLASQGRASREFKQWLRDASLSELMYVLRRGPESLGDNEGRLIEAALGRVPRNRADLRRRLLLRLALAEPGRARKVLGEVGRDPGPLLARARASVFDVAVLLPADGPYAAFAAELRTGIEAGIAYANAHGTVPIEVRFWDTGHDDPARAAAVLDSASCESGVAIGELLSVPTLALASAARVLRLPLVSPTATDEEIGRAGSTVFQIGPSGWQRGLRLFRAVRSSTPQRVAMLISSDDETRPFCRGFQHALEAGGDTLAWSSVYAPGARDFRTEVKRLGIENVDLLFWEGEPEEGAALLREIHRQRLDLKVCGGEALSPANQHRATLSLLDHARYVADDWSVQPGLQAPLDSLVRERGADRVTALNVRGFMAAWLVAAAVQGRALCPEELTASLGSWVRGDPYLIERGFLDWSAAGATLPVYEIERGEAKRLPDR